MMLVGGIIMFVLAGVMLNEYIERRHLLAIVMSLFLVGAGALCLKTVGF